MPRPCIRRKVRGKPRSNYFKPAGRRIRELEEVELTLSEFEAIRWVDAIKVTQEEAGEKMGVSQPTLSRIIKSAREKIGDAIVKGKAIKIIK